MKERELAELAGDEYTPGSELDISDNIDGNN